MSILIITWLDEEARNSGVITQLLIRLLSRCVDETDPDIRDALASCLGEIGAIDPNWLGKEINSSQLLANTAGKDDSSEWRRTNPPWKTPILEYQLWLLKYLVSALLSAPATLDQHKISFAIQELLKILDVQLGGKNENQMTPRLKKKLQEADVCNIVEPFWTTSYKQLDTVAAKSPPFFTKSTSFFSWLSSFCRYLVTRSVSNKNSEWGEFFHACRSAIRSQAGVGVAEFLLPLLILDTLCFGEQVDEKAIVQEFLSVLSVENSVNLKEREKAASVVFAVIDLLRDWCEKETELRYQHSRASRSKRAKPNVVDKDVSETIKKIEQFLVCIPLSSCALAASEVGMHATALQFMEIEGRSRAVLNREKDKPVDDDTSVPKFLKSLFLDGVDMQLLQTLLGQLNDFDTMVFVAQESHQTNPTKRLADEAAEREMYEDWEGAFQAYEQLLDSRFDDESNCSNSAIANTKISSQKGLLNCLLKLGRLDSVLHQAYGMSKQRAVHGNAMQVCVDFLPSAAEAAWRLGKWSVLDQLVTSLDDKSAFDADARYQLSFGRTILSLHSKSYARVSCLKESRGIVMSSLTSAARDGYTRSYPHLMQLHALREVEQVSSLFEDQSNCQESFIKAVSCDQWSKRLDFSTPDITGSNLILNTRLALSRMANVPSIEGSMWLDIGKAARKGGLYQVAEHSLTRANVMFCKHLSDTASTENSVSLSDRELVGNIKLQVAKLKHAIGESTVALKLIEDKIPASIFYMDDTHLKQYFESKTNAESGESIARKVLQATEWMVCDGLKSSSEINDRYQTVLKLAPNWERGTDRAHFSL